MSRYLDLMRSVLTGMIYQDPPVAVSWLPHLDYQEATRQAGTDWPGHAHTMIGAARLASLQSCAERALDDGVPGDFLETGCWRGGACILLRAVLADRGITGRAVWVADSFEGLPPGSGWERQDVLSVSLEEVQRNFAAYGLLDDQVRFLPGWFASTLPRAPVRELAVLRLDGDLYSSQRDALAAMEPRVSPGGFVVVDDYHFPGCRKAVDEYRAARSITAAVHQAAGNDYTVFWRKEGAR